jgi:nicotinate-nucleotide pyrophosphorylase (carboxylating)
MDFLSLKPLIRQALQEDLGSGDITSEAILEQNPRSDSSLESQVLAKESFTLAGWSVFTLVFELLGEVEAEPRFAEGALVQPGLLGSIRARPSILLRGERLALNFLQRMCGVATLTRQCVDLVAPTGVRVLDTRKTTPLWRDLEKYAVRMGGGSNHRRGLYDGVLIKENHILLAGGIHPALEACRRRMHHLQKIEVEVTSLEELDEALDGGADAVLLDNMEPEMVVEAVALARGRCPLEVSGGVNQGNLRQYAETGVNFISLGALTHSAEAVDISLVVVSN